MTVVCNDCGKEWPRHPALEVVCPKCHAGVGMGCTRPSGHSGPLIELHIEREQRAVDEDVLQLCPEGPTAKSGSERKDKAVEPQPALL